MGVHKDTLRGANPYIRKLVKQKGSEGWVFERRGNSLMATYRNGERCFTHSWHGDSNAVKAFRKDLERIELRSGGIENEGSSSSA